MKHLIPLFLLLLAACSSEDPIVPGAAPANDFTIADNPDDPVQHARYELYREYGVPVYFNDTIAKRQKGTDLQGNPIYSYETVDLAWTFSTYTHNVKYSYQYITDAAEQLRALDYVRDYLKTVSKPMRPFSIMVADTLTVQSSNKIEKPVYHVGYRTLVFAQVKDLTDPAERSTQIQSTINSMISDRVRANREVCARFSENAKEKGWYYTEWSKLPNCPTITLWMGKSWIISVNGLYDEPPFTTYNNEDLIAVLTQTSPAGTPWVSDYDEAIAIRKNMLAEMANYGFLRGWKDTGRWTPRTDDEDREYYLQAMLHLGDGGFRQRYGAYKLVMEKYEPLYEFVTQQLGVNLDYNNFVED